MSNRARLILLSGVGGAGTSTLTAATAAALEAEGLAATVIDSSATEPLEPYVVEQLNESVGRLGADIGADPLIAEAWASLPGASALSTLQRARAALADTRSGAVVLDAGPLRAARDLVDLPAAMTRLLDAMLTPRLAMWRSNGSSGDDTLFEALSGLRLDVLRLRQMLISPATTMRLVTTPARDAVTRTERALGLFAMLGVGVDGVIVNKVPRKSEGWPVALRAEADEGVDRMRSLAAGLPVWTSTSKIRAVPKGRSALGPLGRVCVLDAEQLTVVVGDEEFTMELPLAGTARAEARVGRQGDQLVVAFDGGTRWIDLAPVLRRCRAVDAVRTDRGLVIRFAPDPAAWRQPEVVS